MKMKAFLVSIALLTSGGVAHAVPVQVDFTANGFNGGPLSTLSGSLFYEAATLTSVIDSLTDIDLSINGHDYTVGELGFQSSGNTVVLGGLIHSINAIVGATDHDILFGFDRVAQTFSFFAYSTPGIGNIIPISNSGTVSIHQRVTNVPEPATLSLLGLGLFGTVAMRRKKSI